MENKLNMSFLKWTLAWNQSSTDKCFLEDTQGVIHLMYEPLYKNCAQLEYLRTDPYPWRPNSVFDQEQ